MRKLDDPGIYHLVKQLKNYLQSLSEGYLQLNNRLLASSDENNFVLYNDFKQVMKDMIVPISDIDIRTLFFCFDVNRTGSIKFETFMDFLKEDLDENRLTLVEVAWKKLAGNKDSISISEVVKHYDSSYHSDVRRQIITQEEALSKFLAFFPCAYAADGNMSKKNFVDYYRILSPSIENYDRFNRLLCNTWHLTDEYIASAVKSDSKLGKKSNKQSKSGPLTNGLVRAGAPPVQMGDFLAAKVEQEEIGGRKKQPMMPTAVSDLIVGQVPPDDSRECRRAFVEIPEREKVVIGGLAESDPWKTTHQLASHGQPVGERIKQYKKRPSSSSGVREKLYEAVSTVTGAPMYGNAKWVEKIKEKEEALAKQTNSRKNNNQEEEEDDEDDEDLNSNNIPTDRKTIQNLRKLRDLLKHRGSSGILGMSKKFKILDDDQSGNIDFKEFSKCVFECGVVFPDAELKSLFALCDTDKSGTISYDEFIRLIRVSILLLILLLIYIILTLPPHPNVYVVFMYFCTFRRVL